MKRFIVLTAMVLMGFLAGSASALEPAVGDWIYHGHDFRNTKYTPLDEINKDNFDQVEVAWTWDSIETKVTLENRRVIPSQFKPTPLVVSGIMYLPTSVGQVVAVNGGTGELLWEFDTGSWKGGRPANLGFQHRGASYWTDGKGDERIMFASHDLKLWALDAETGQPVESFGENGRVDLSTSLGRPINPRGMTHSSPVGICNDTVIVGSIIFDGPSTKEMPPGHVRGFDVRTGEMKWIFHTIPQEGEFGVETWENDSWKYSGNTNVWSMFATDEELGYVYMPVSTPTNDMYGGHRLGDNLFAESIVCVDADTGKRIWHFQAVHHGLWDYDFPTAPNLVDITVDGKNIKAVAQVSKQAFCYVLDRVTGEPVWPIEEVPVPESKVPGERSSHTQPHPTRPAAYDRQGLTEFDLIDFTPDLRAKALKILEGYQMGPLFTPPTSTQGTVGLPSAGGGSNWQGAALDPETGVLYVPSVTTLGYWMAVKPDASRSNLRYISSFMGGKAPNQAPLEGLPIMKPPYSRITAIDLNSGDHLWMTPHGDGPINHPLVKDLNLPPMGALTFGGNGPVVTKSLLLVTQLSSRLGTERDQQPKINVFDKATGELLGMIPLPGEPYGNPVVYLHEGKQYIAVALGGGGFMGGRGPGPAKIVALSLP